MPNATVEIGRDWEILDDGRKISKWSLTNPGGAGMTVMDLGATILTVSVPDRHGNLADVMLGFEKAADYLADNRYCGAVIGRYANRIANGSFSIDGKDYQIETNDGPHTLHGGSTGFDKRQWNGQTVETKEGSGVAFTLISADGEQGFPGELTVSTTYIWTGDNRLIIDYHAVSDAATPFNITQHSYWNLSGTASTSALLDHRLSIDADHYLPVSRSLVPLGEQAPVAGSPFDFRTAKPLGRDCDSTHEQLRYGNGFDHNWVLNGAGLREISVLTDPGSGRRMTMSTDMPGLQFYSGNFLDGGTTGKNGQTYTNRCAAALETQFFPDSPNQPSFPNTILRPGSPFASRTIFAFDCFMATL